LEVYSADGKTEANNVFKLVPGQDEHSGVVQTAKLFDRDGANADDAFYIVKIVASSTVTLCSLDNCESPTTTVEFKVSVEAVDDNAPTFSKPTYTVDDYGKSTEAGCRSNSENFDVCEVGVAAGAGISADDIDGDGAVKYSLREELPGGDSLYYFSISATGEITNLKEIDYEKTSQFRFLVVANEGTKESVATVVINVFNTNDNKPEMFTTSLQLTLTEEATEFNPKELGGDDAVVYATDADADASSSSNLTYRILNVEPQWAADKFAVDPGSGRVLVSDRNGIDYEDFCEGVKLQAPCNEDATSAEVVLTITVKDGADGHDATTAATVTITLNDFNDNAATIPYVGGPRNVEISEITPMYVTLFSVTPEDRDVSLVNSRVELTVSEVQTNTKVWDQAPYFEVKPASGIPEAGVPRDIWLTGGELAYDEVNTQNNDYTVQLWARNGANAVGQACSSAILPADQLLSEDEKSTKCGSKATVQVKPFIKVNTADVSQLILDYKLPESVAADASLSLKVVATGLAGKRTEYAAISLTGETMTYAVEPSRTYTFELSGSLTFVSRQRREESTIRIQRTFTRPSANFGPTALQVKTQPELLEVTYNPAPAPNEDPDKDTTARYYVCWCDVTENGFMGGDQCCQNRQQACDDGKCSLTPDDLSDATGKNMHFVLMVQTLRAATTLQAYSDDVVVEVPRPSANAPSTFEIASGGSAEEENNLGNAGIAGIVLLIFVLIVGGLIFAYKFETSQSSKSYELHKEDVEAAPRTDEEKIDALKGKIFEDAEDNSAESGPVLPQATEKQEKYYDYFASQRQNAFLGGPADGSTPQYAGGYLDVNPYAPSGEHKGGAGAGAPAFDAGGPVEQQTMQQTRQDNFNLAFAARAQTTSTIPAAEIVERIDDMKRRGTIDAEFAQIKADTMNFPVSFTASQEQYNLKKNRYLNVKPLDSTRVKLSHSGTLGGDYVNANYVSGWQQPKAYIATQGPIPGTFTDFWRMIWEENTGVIVMVTKETEMGKRKCDKYWPEQGQPLQCGTLEVLYRDYDDSDESLCIRRMELRSSIFNESREVVQYQVKSWPDQGVPENGGQFLQLVHQVREETQSAMGRGQNGPVVTHCSAGIGRTGTFIAVDTTLRRLLAAGNIDLMSTVNHMRQERVGSVQTIAQYRFCYDAIQQYVAINGIHAPPTGPSASDELSDAELNSLATLAGLDDGMTDAKLLEQLQQILTQ